jgi:hypothetical protein
MWGSSAGFDHRRPPHLSITTAKPKETQYYLGYIYLIGYIMHPVDAQFSGFKSLDDA